VVRDRAEEQLSVVIFRDALVILPAAALSKFVFGKVGFSPFPTDVTVLHVSKSQVFYS